VDDVATGDMRTRVRTMLGNFLFSGEDIEKKVKVLSGGERSRLALCRMLFTPVNLLVLDEPTNHLDMRSKDILKNALLQYDGTLVIVSHDRDFLQGLTSKVYEFRNRRIREYIGDIYAFLESRRLSTLSELERKAAQARTTVSEPPSVQKVLREERKEHEKGVRKLKNQLGKIEEEIHHRETEQSLINIKLADPLTYARDIEQYDLFSRYESLKKEIEVLMQDWEKLAGDIEALEGRRRRDD
jgi:ATP-binding cassette subfamily F protein 3